MILRALLLLISPILLTLVLLPVSCSEPDTGSELHLSDYYRQYMRDLVREISAFAKEHDHDFFIIPQNGHELLVNDLGTYEIPASDYISAIDGVGREDLFYGYYEDNEATPIAVQEEIIAFLDIAEKNGIEVLVTDYCRTYSHIDSSYERNNSRGYISFAADDRELDNIPAYPATPYNKNDSAINSLADARNFLYIINNDQYPDKEAFLTSIRQTDFDLIILDLFYDNTPLTVSDIASLRKKHNGGSRLLIAYMSIGEAEDYRYYWHDEWSTTEPDWLAEENPEWTGNYKVRYWDEDWQSIIYGNDDSYLQKIINAGFDGVYLDIIGAYEYFER